jgi:hypothetical protein
VAPQVAGRERDTVQIVEATDSGVRVVQLRLRRPGSALQFLLFPMIHVGRPEFYQDVTRRLGSVDLIVAEGVGAGTTSDRLTSTYRTAVEDGQLGLVVQEIDYRALGVPVLNPDFSGQQVEERWATIPGWQRGLLRAGIGSMVTAQRLLGPRLLKFQLRQSTLEDLPTLAELFSPALLENLDRVIVHERDDLLLAALTAVHEERSGEAITVAVVYGAEHMRSVVTRLRPLGYRVVSGDWLTVVEF